MRALVAALAEALAAHARKVAAEIGEVSEGTYIRGYADGYKDGAADTVVIRSSKVHR